METDCDHYYRDQYFDSYLESRHDMRRVDHIVKWQA